MHLRRDEPHDRKLTLVCQSMRGGGVESLTTAIANNLFVRGYSIDLVLLEKKGPNLACLADGVRVIDIGRRGIAGSIVALARYFRAHEPVVVLSALTHPTLITILARWLSRRQFRLATSVHSDLHMVLNRYGPIARQKLLVYLSWIYPRCDAVVAVSEGVRRSIVNVGKVPPDKVVRIYNPVVPSNLSDLLAEPLTHPWFQSEQPPVILGVGRLVPAKDFDTLLHAFAQVRRKESCRLVILGSGNQRVALQSLISELKIADSVDMPGYVSNPYPWFAGASVFALSSVREGLGNVIIQALACGTPVVATDCPSGPREILDDGAFGRLVPPRSPEALAEGILATLNDKNDVATQQRRRDRANSFTVDRAVDLYEQVLWGEAQG